MAAKAKHAPSTPSTEPQSPYVSITGVLGEWIRQGTEGFVAGQKIMLDLAAQQNALALNIIRERVGFSTPSTKKVADFAGKSVKTLLDVQRNVLDLVIRQNSILQATLVPRLRQTQMRALAEVAYEGFDNFVQAEKQFLDALQTQAEGAISDFREGNTPELSRLSELARSGMDAFLDSQKRFLDIVQDHVTSKAETEGEEAEQAEEALELLDMLKQSVDATIQSQERLLDLASKQVKTSVTFAGEVFSFNVQPTTLSDVAKKSIDSFVAAQKALVEVASKPRSSQHSAGRAGHAVA